MVVGDNVNYNLLFGMYEIRVVKSSCQHSSVDCVLSFNRKKDSNDLLWENFITAHLSHKEPIRFVAMIKEGIHIST